MKAGLIVALEQLVELAVFVAVFARVVEVGRTVFFVFVEFVVLVLRLV